MLPKFRKFYQTRLDFRFFIYGILQYALMNSARFDIFMVFTMNAKYIQDIFICIDFYFFEQEATYS